MKARSLCEKCDRVLEARCRLASHAGCWKRPHVVLNFHVRSQAGRRSCRRDRSRSREATEGHPKHPCGLPRAILSGDDPKITIDELLETAKSVDALLITLNEKCRKDVIDRMPENVKCISTFSIARNATAEKIIELSLRRLLHCLDAALPFIEGDLHVINIAPVAVSFGIPVATAFLGAKLATTKLHVAPRLRMSTVSPFDSEPLEDGSLARTILHLMKEQRSPDVVETVLRRPLIEPRRHVKPPHTRSKVSMQI